VVAELGLDRGVGVHRPIQMILKMFQKTFPPLAPSSASCFHHIDIVSDSGVQQLANKQK
jgi:hypothetical protein